MRRTEEKIRSSTRANYHRRCGQSYVAGQQPGRTEMVLRPSGIGRFMAAAFVGLVAARGR